MLLVGARTATKHLPTPILAPAADTLRRATDDGSSGHAGFVTELVQAELAQKERCAVYGCGPHAMMEAVAVLCMAAQVPCQVSLEEYMACGIGICMGCPVELVTAQGATDYHRYARICVEGPVFDAQQILWTTSPA